MTIRDIIYQCINLAREDINFPTNTELTSRTVDAILPHIGAETQGFDAWWRKIEHTFDYDVPTADIAELAYNAGHTAAQAVKVKALVWEKHPDEPEWYATFHDDGHTKFGYMVLPTKKHKFGVYSYAQPKVKIGKSHILDSDARAAAQAHNQALYDDMGEK